MDENVKMDLEDAENILEECITHFRDIYDGMRAVADICRRNSKLFEYNMSGNIEGYVVNHIDGFIEKLENYLEDIKAVKDVEVPEDDEE
jgi:hypothetical protein